MTEAGCFGRRDLLKGFKKHLYYIFPQNKMVSVIISGVKWQRIYINMQYLFIFLEPYFRIFVRHPVLK